MNTTAKTDSAFSKGLEDIVAAESSICLIDGKNSKLSYRGYDIHDLAEHSTFEETAYLLLFGALPTSGELSDFSAKLAAERAVPAELIDSLKKFPKKINEMAALRSAVSLLSFYDPEADDKSPESQPRKAVRLLAKTPTLIAALDRLRKGQEPIAPKLNASANTAQNFLTMLKGAEPTPVQARMLDKYFILLAEHDLNASTFAMIVTVSTLSDLYSGAVSAIGTLKGDLHGSANSRAMESLIAIGSIDRVETYVDDAIKNKKKLMGFGHRVYKGPDPRAFDLRNMARTLAESDREQAKWFAISEKLEKVVWDRKKLNCNVDFYSASVLYTIGIPIDLFTPMFAVSRMAGWAAHALEQYADNRLIRPVSEYVGQKNLAYVSLQDRH